MLDDLNLVNLSDLLPISMTGYVLSFELGHETFDFSVNISVVPFRHLFLDLSIFITGPIF